MYYFLLDKNWNAVFTFKSVTKFLAGSDHLQFSIMLNF